MKEFPSIGSCKDHSIELYQYLNKNKIYYPKVTYEHAKDYIIGWNKKGWWMCKKTGKPNYLMFDLFSIITDKKEMFLIY